MKVVDKWQSVARQQPPSNLGYGWSRVWLYNDSWFWDSLSCNKTGYKYKRTYWYFRLHTTNSTLKVEILQNSYIKTVQESKHTCFPKVIYKDLSQNPFICFFVWSTFSAHIYQTWTIKVHNHFVYTPPILNFLLPVSHFLWQVVKCFVI